MLLCDDGSLKTILFIILHLWVLRVMS